MSPLIVACSGGSGGGGGGFSPNPRLAAERDEVMQLTDHEFVASIAPTLTGTAGSHVDSIDAILTFIPYPNSNTTESAICQTGSAAGTRSNDRLDVQANDCDLSFDPDALLANGRSVFSCAVFNASNNTVCDVYSVNLSDFSFDLREGGSGSESRFLENYSGSASADFRSSTRTTASLNTLVSLLIENAGTPGISAELSYQNFQIVVDDLGGGDEQISVNGQIGLAGDFGSAEANASKCAVGGTVTVSTLTPVIYDSDLDRNEAGRVLLSNTDNQQADVTFEANGDISVTIGGQTRRYSESQIDAICA